MNIIDAIVHERIRAEAHLIETACERMLTTGTWGVLVMRGSDCLIADIHPAVPYGHLYEAPGQTADPDELARRFATWEPRR